MNNMPDNETIVLEIAGNFARVECYKGSDESHLVHLGFSKKNGSMAREIKDDSDRRDLVISLVNLGAIFSRGRDWSPSEVVGYYRDRGLPIKSYRTIGWKGPSTFEIYDEP